MLTLAICQLILCLVLLQYIIIDYKSLDPITSVPKSVFACKFVCGLALHLLVTDNEMQGLQMVKHTINHKYKFNNYVVVCITGFTQFMIALFCELLNYAYILSSNSPIDIVG